MKQRLEEIRERVGRATECEWVAVVTVAKDGSGEGVSVSSRERAIPGETPVFTIAKCGKNDEPSRNDALFIAHARQDVPWLLGQLEAKDKELEELRLALQKIALTPKPNPVGYDSDSFGTSEDHYEHGVHVGSYFQAQIAQGALKEWEGS